MEDKEKELIKQLKESVSKSIQIAGELAKHYESICSDSHKNLVKKKVLIEALGTEEYEQIFKRMMYNYALLASVSANLSLARIELKKLCIDRTKENPT